MAAWAYACRPCDGTATTWYVPQTAVDEMPAEVRAVRVHVGSEWLCAVVDRRGRVSVDAMLLRQVIPSNEADCPACAEALRAADRGGAGPGGIPAPEPDQPEATSARTAAPAVQAAAISLAGIRLVVVAVSLDLVRSPGEADMAIETLTPRFGGVPVVLMGQNDEGSPVYYGDRTLVGMLDGVPLDKMPWKAYHVG